jgi:hypothetical protein
MAKRQTFNLLDKTFQTKADFKEFFKTILNKYDLNAAIGDTDLQYVSELLKRHPEYQKKIGSGINEIVIKTDGKWGKTRCFHIQRTDGTQTDFSYINCIDNEISREPMRMFRLSARNAVEEQIIAHLSSYISRNKDNTDNVLCQKSRTKIHKKNATVDHIPPMTFDKIVTDFLQFKKLDPSQIEYVGFGDNEYHKEFKDNNIKTEFENYHRHVAKLRVISRHENLTQKKKSFGQQIALDL